MACGAINSDRWSSARLARTSCVIPIPEFTTMMATHAPWITEDQGQRAERRQNQVEHRQNVRADDAPVGTARAKASEHTRLLQTPGRFLFAQSSRKSAGANRVRKLEVRRGRQAGALTFVWLRIYDATLAQSRLLVIAGGPCDVE